MRYNLFVKNYLFKVFSGKEVLWYLTKKENLNKQKFLQDETRAHCFEWMNFLFFKYLVAVRDFDVSVGDRVFHIKKGERGAFFDSSSRKAAGQLDVLIKIVKK